MGYLRIEDYVTAGEIVASNLSRDLSLFTKQYKNIDSDYLEKFRKQLASTKDIESSFIVTEEQKKLTQELYNECTAFADRLMFMRTYAKEARLNHSIVTTIITQLRQHNVEGALKNCRDAITYYTSNAEALSISNMPETFPDEIIENCTQIETLNNQHKTFLVNKKEKIAKTNAVYKQLLATITEICNAGKLIFKHDPVMSEEYTLKKIVSVLQTSRKKKNETPPETPQSENS